MNTDSTSVLTSEAHLIRPRLRNGESSSFMTLSETAGAAMLIQEQTLHSSRSIISKKESGCESISPEPLSDTAPTLLPQPHSVGRALYSTGSNGNIRMQRPVSGDAISAPVSLVGLPKAHQIQISPSLNNHRVADDHVIDRLTLPEAGTPRSQLSGIDARPNIQATATLNFSSARTYNLEPLPPPTPTQRRAAATVSISQKSSTLSADCTSPTRESLHFASRNTEKCSGDSSVRSDTAPIILVPKRNYQNLLDETHLRGVSYPTELSQKPTPKRTSQSLAEQGRRKRLNSALQELTTLLPKGCKKDSAGEKNSGQDRNPREGDKGGSSCSGGTAWAASKASIVESAIEYIKQLKDDMDDANKRVRVAEKKLRMRHNSEGIYLD